MSTSPALSQAPQEPAAVEIQQEEAKQKNRKQFYEALDKHAFPKKTETAEQIVEVCPPKQILFEARDYYPRELYEKMQLTIAVITTD